MPPANQRPETNTKHVIYRPYSGGVGSAGQSAVKGYRAELAGRRRGALRSAACLVGALALAWWALHLSGDPRLAAGAAAAAMACAAVLARPRPDPERWLRGAAGEVATAELLDRLPPRDWVVFHDLAVPGSRANIDHLAIGRTGVWVIDTKTTRGRARRGLFGLRLGDRRVDTGPLMFEAQVVADRLGVDTRPVIAVHGDTGLPRRGVRCAGIRVVPAGGLLAHMGRRRWSLRRTRLRRAEVHRLAGLAQAEFAPAGCTGRNGGGTGPRAIRGSRSHG